MLFFSLAFGLPYGFVASGFPSLQILDFLLPWQWHIYDFCGSSPAAKIFVCFFPLKLVSFHLAYL